MVNNHYSQENVTRFTYNSITAQIVQSINDRPNYQKIFVETVKEGSAATTYIWIYYTDTSLYEEPFLSKECYYVCSYHIFEPIKEYRSKIELAFITHLHNYYMNKQSKGINENV